MQKTILLLAIILAGTISLAGVSADTFKPPRQQMAAGVPAEEVICMTGYQLMVKNDGSAACVLPSTAERLFSAGWGEIIEGGVTMDVDTNDDAVKDLEEKMELEDEGQADESEEKVEKKISLSESMDMSGG